MDFKKIQFAFLSVNLNLRPYTWTFKIKEYYQYLFPKTTLIIKSHNKFHGNLYKTISS